MLTQLAKCVSLNRVLSVGKWVPDGINGMEVGLRDAGLSAALWRPSTRKWNDSGGVLRMMSDCHGNATPRATPHVLGRAPRDIISQPVGGAVLANSDGAPTAPNGGSSPPGTGK